jgi:hypothetical protein
MVTKVKELTKKVNEIEKELLGIENIDDIQLKKILEEIVKNQKGLAKEIETLREDEKQHTVFTLLGDKKGIYMNMLTAGYQYGIFAGSILFYAFDPMGLASALRSQGLIDLLAKIGGFGGSILYGTASQRWLKYRMREYKWRRIGFEENFGSKDERLYFPWEKEGSKLKKIVDFFHRRSSKKTLEEMKKDLEAMKKDCEKMVEEVRENYISNESVPADVYEKIKIYDAVMKRYSRLCKELEKNLATYEAQKEDSKR